VVSPSGRVVLERDWEWPGVDQRIPPGAYQVTAYSRTCDGNCDVVDPASFSCTIDVLAEPSFTYTMKYQFSREQDVSCEAATNES
jgi:hypothetical protein